MHKLTCLLTYLAYKLNAYDETEKQTNRLLKCFVDGSSVQRLGRSEIVRDVSALNCALRLAAQFAEGVDLSVTQRYKIKYHINTTTQLVS